MKRTLLALSLVCATAAFPQSPPAAVTPTPAEIQKKVEAYLRKLYAWGPAFQLKLGAPANAPTPDLYQIPLEVTFQGQTESATIYVSKDGRYIFRGELDEMSVDPFAAARAKIHLKDNPSIGPADARVTVVEFSDFECPHCRELAEALKALEPGYPQVRFIFKDFPITEIHPWAMTAAIAGRCAYLQNPAAFWKLHNAVFDNQDLVKPENAWDKMLAFAGDAGLNLDAFRSCMASREAKQAVEANLAEGKALKINSTPTVFVNGRPLVGGNKELLEQYIKYELDATAR